MHGTRTLRAGGSLIGAVLAAQLVWGQAAVRDSQTPGVLSPEHRLYAQHCAGCHGLNGAGDGVAAGFLFPKPRNFRVGKFRLASTGNSVPSEADLDALLVRGMPGSSMPSWPRLTRDERALLIKEVYRLTKDGARERYLANLKTEQGLTNEEIQTEDLQAEIEDFAQGRITPGAPAAVPVIVDADAAAIARGKQHFATQGCLSCHGAEGKGDGVKKMFDDEGFPTRPRDLTRGIYKGGHDPASIFLRIARGMPGTPMPSSPSLTESQVVDLVHYLRSLSTEEQRQAPILNRENLVVRYVAALPGDANAEAWRDSQSANVRLMPLWWRDDAVPAVRVWALHDGRTVAFRLEWDDPIADTHAGKVEAFKDAVALEFVRGPDEPFLGMGSSATPIDLWMWDADRGRSGGDLEDVNPRVVVDVYPFNELAVESAEFARPGTSTAAQPDISLPARALGNQVVRLLPRPTGGSSLTAAGPGSTTFRFARSQIVSATGAWEQGRWTVVLRRSLSVAEPGDGLELVPGGTASMAIALWDGSHRDRNGQKQVSIWQDLVLEATR